LLFRHPSGVRRDKSHNVEKAARWEVIQLPPLCLLDGLPRFIESLQGE
jgi:hypothetical protein